MRKIISGLLVLCFLLCGCSQPEAAEPVFTPAQQLAPQGLYDAGSGLEISSSGAIQLYPLGNRTGKGLLVFGDGLLLFSEGDRTSLTLLSGETLVPQAVKSLGFSLEPEACTITEDALSFFDPVKRQTLVLDSRLEVVGRIDTPATAAGTPLLSGDRLYYCAGSTLRVWDLSTNIHRVLRDAVSPDLQFVGLQDHGAVLHCMDGSGVSRFYCSETGALLFEEDSAMKLVSLEDGYAAALWETNLWSLIFSLEEGRKQALTPRELASEYYLLKNQPGVVTASRSGKVVTLDHYDLSSGRRTATVMLRGQMPASIADQGGILWGLTYLEEYQGNAIFRWDPGRTPVADSNCYTGNHYTASQPDHTGLANCKETAHALGSAYGLEILIWQEAASHGANQQPEHRVNILNRELELLDHRLAQFPAGMLETTAKNFPALTLCLVAQSSSQSCTLNQQATISLPAGSTSEAGLYHGLFHVMETHILSHSSALDQWVALNPQGFRYDYDYAANAIRDSGIYLTEKNRAFIDTFSMSYPKEDRARIFEAAMLPENSHLFETQTMQKKLAAICRGIREAYGLSSMEIYPWEQYLK